MKKFDKKIHFCSARTLICWLMIFMSLSACNAVNTAVPATSVVPQAQATSTAPSPPLKTAPPTALPTLTSGAVRATAASTATAELQNTPNIPAAQNAVSFPDPAGFRWNAVVSGLAKPLDLASPPDGLGRLFILEQPGTIRIYQNGALLPDPFLDIRSRIQSRGNEQGLLGIAFDPNYAKNGFFYVNYTGLTGIGDTFISRFQVSAGDKNRADPRSEKILLHVTQPFRNHNGGGLAFGPDGFLYIGLGDGGSANDPHGNGQSLDILLGKLLRINVDAGDPYQIPGDNPFISGGGKAEIWAYGLRNPWRFSFDRLTGDLYIGDVGQDLWEEVDFLPAGSPGGTNFGWNIREGTHPFNDASPGKSNLIDPIFDYPHGADCSITGGYVYRGKSLPDFAGIYLFSDFCSGRVRGLLRTADGKWQEQTLFETGFNVTSFGQDSNGEIYLMDQPSGTVYRLERN